MFFCQKLLFFIMLLLGITATVSAQTTKQVEALPTPHTEEVKYFSRPAAMPTLEMQQAQQAQQAQEEKQAEQVNAEQKELKEKEALEQEKARLLEVDKPANDEWRTKLAEQNAKYENAAIAKEVPESQSRPVAKKEDWKQLITTTQTELQQTTDPAMRQKLQNKIAILQKKEKAISNETSK